MKRWAGIEIADPAQLSGYTAVQKARYEAFLSALPNPEVLRPMLHPQFRRVNGALYDPRRRVTAVGAQKFVGFREMVDRESDPHPTISIVGEYIALEDLYDTPGVDLGIDLEAEPDTFWIGARAKFPYVI